MKKNQVILTLAAILVALALGWYLRGVFEHSGEVETGPQAVGRKNPTNIVGRGLDSQQSAALAREEANVSGRAGGQQSAQPLTSSAPPVLQPSEVDPDATNTQFASNSPAATDQRTYSPATQPALEVVDVKVSSDGTLNYIVRLPSANGKGDAGSLVKLPPNVRPDEIELEPDGAIVTIKRQTDTGRPVPPSKKKTS